MKARVWLVPVLQPVVGPRSAGLAYAFNFRGNSCSHWFSFIFIRQNTLSGLLFDLFDLFTSTITHPKVPYIRHACHRPVTLYLFIFSKNAYPEFTAKIHVIRRKNRSQCLLRSSFKYIVAFVGLVRVPSCGLQ